MAEGDGAARASTSATVIVVPIPEVAASSFERWKTRRLASWISEATRSSPRSSPALLVERRRREPRRDLAGLSAAHPVGDGEERRRADESVLVPPPAPARVGHACACGPAIRPPPGSRSGRRARRRPSRAAGRRHAGAVHEGAVRGADVLDPDPVAPRLEASVLRRSELVAVERDLVLPAAADLRRASSRPDLLAGVERGALEDDQPGAFDGREPEARGLRRPMSTLSWAGAPGAGAEVAARAAHDPPDEEIEQDDEGDLQDQERSSTSTFTSRSFPKDEVRWRRA